MPQLWHCPPAKHHEDRNPKYHEEQQNDVAEIVAAHPPKNVERERTCEYYSIRRNILLLYHLRDIGLMLKIMEDCTLSVIAL
jgi:hypothetical protein